MEAARRALRHTFRHLHLFGLTPIISIWRSCSRCSSTTATAQEPAYSPHDENQYRNRDNCQRHKVVNGVGKNVFRMSRVEAVEGFKRSWQRC
jgi:hypothetical protein